MVPTSFAPVASNVKVIAGTDTVAPAATGCDGGPCGANVFFAISFNGVTFSAASFYLFISQNGFANVNETAGDIAYAGPFAASDLAGAGAYQAKGIGGGITGASYWIGSIAGPIKLIVGPIPVQISTAYKYVKIYDGSCGSPSPTLFCGGTGIAGAIQLVAVQPGIVISPKSGPAWTSVLVSGGGFAANNHVNINYSFTYMDWNTGAGSLKHGQVTTGIATGSGFFSNIPMSMVDTKQAQNTPAGLFQSTVITLTAVNGTFPHILLNGAQNTAAPVKFTEFDRQFNQVSSYFSGATVSVSAYAANAAAYGNATCTGGAEPCGTATKYASTGGATAPFVPGQWVDVFVTGKLGIVGSNFTVSGPVKIMLGGVLAGTVNASSSGHFVANVTVPKLPVGENVAEAVANGVDYQFTIDVQPTLILSPNHGAIGSEAGTTPTVTATAYGFPANSWVSLWWGEHTTGDGNDYFLLNSTIDSTGSYNHTVTFIVPPDVYGGGHGVAATSTKEGPTTLDTTIDASAGFVTETTFTVTPSIIISPTSVNANTKGWFSVDGDGFDPTKPYYVQVDNSLSLSGAPGLIAGTDGDLIINFTSAGFRPGVHQIELFDWTTALGTGSYAPTVWAYFNVTATGDFIGNAVASLQTSLTGIQASLTSVQTSLSSVQSQLSSISTTLSGVSSALSGITSSLSGITSTLSSITSSLTGISGSLSSIQASLTTITGDVSGLGTTLTSLQQSATSLQSSVSSLSSSVSGLGTQLSGVTSSLSSMGNQLTSIGADAHTAATQATAAASSAANAVTGNSTAQTYVLVVAVLAAITLVLELAILVRKLS